MATTAMIKRRKILPPNKGVRKTKGGARRKRAPTQAEKVTTPTHKPYQWDKDDEGTTVTKQKVTCTVEATSDNITDTSEDESDDDDEDVTDVSARGKEMDSAPTPPTSTISVRINEKETFDSLQEHIARLQNRNAMLSRQIKDVSKIGGVDRYEVMQLRKVVKEDLFKRVKFITTMATETKCLQYLSNKLNVLPETRRDWCATYAHCVRDALNNKRNNVSQDLKAEIKGKTRKRSYDLHIRKSLTHVQMPLSTIAILAETETENIEVKAFLNIREAKNIIQQKYFNLFFDRLLPCVAGKKVWTNKDKMTSTITEGAKISITDEAFTELCLLNYWNKWTKNESAQWTDARGGNTHFKGWNNDAYLKFDGICRRISTQRETEDSKAMEEKFRDYAVKQYRRGSMQSRSGVLDEGPELFNELIEL